MSTVGISQPEFGCNLQVAPDNTPDFERQAWYIVNRNLHWLTCRETRAFFLAETWIVVEWPEDAQLGTATPKFK